MAINPDLIRGIKNFVQPKFSNEKSSPPKNLICVVCGSRKFWNEDGAKIWCCETCHPPGSDSQVERPNVDQPRSEVRPREAPGSSVRTLLQKYDIQAMFPVCRECMSQMYVERVWSDWSVSCQCISCGADVDGEPKPHLVEEARLKREAKLQAEFDAMQIKS